MPYGCSLGALEDGWTPLDTNGIAGLCFTHVSCSALVTATHLFALH
jgi:hypothetical protein